jgi:hypothetical protein
MKKFVAVMAVSFLTACAGNSVVWNQARQLKVGMTEKEVTEVMGRPYQAGGVDKEETYRWVWVDVDLKTGSQTISAEFKHGTVVSIPFIPDWYGH